MRKTALFILLSASISMGAVAPRFQAEKLGGGRLTLDETLSKGKAVLITFWATWCVPCLEELKALKEGFEKDENLPFDVIAVNVDTPETASDVRSTVKRYGLKFPVLLDPKHEVFSKYQKAASLPFSALLSPKGEILETFSGLHEGMIEKMIEVVTRDASARKG